MKLRGVLCRDADGEYFFRHYTKDGEFVDYNILADEIEMTINDSNITSKKLDNDVMILDYTEEILGKKNK